MPQPSLRDTKDEVRPNELVKVITHEPQEEGLENIPVTPGNYRKFKGNNRRGLPRGILLGIFGIIAIFIGGSLLSLYAFRGKVAGSVAANLTTLRLGVTDLQNLDTKAAQQKFSSLQDLSGSDLGVLADDLGYLFSGGRDTIASFADLSKQLTLLAQELDAMGPSGFDFLVNGRGAALTAQLGQLRDTVSAIDTASNKLSDAASFAGGLSSLGGGDLYLSMKSQVAGAKKFLDAFVPWLADPGTHHVLVLLQNPSEIRPAGGFLGSYADVTLAHGDIEDVSVHDIADVDAAFAAKIVPPRPLQPLVTRWRPADANWFFDFPTSASKTAAFFEASDLYQKTGITFDGVVAVSPKIISDLLAITGPIVLGKPTTTFAADTVLVQIQKSVQNGQATDATYPKQVLRDLSRALFAKLSSSADQQKKDMLLLALDWAAKKEIMAYFKDPAIETFLDAYGASGAAYELPQKFNGDYFALVDANVGGGKSDLYVSSTVSYSAQINADGTLVDHVLVTRVHHGDQSPYSWYRTTSQDYMQLFVPDATTLANASGGVVKKITAPANYAAGGYAADPLVAAIEGTEQTIFGFPAIAWHEESGKKVFTTWSTMKAGASAKISFDYSHRLFLPPAEGVGYQFVFEKQAGTARNYIFDINAPLGYQFAENGLSSYEYKSSDMPGRVIIDLTLTKLQQ